jgi:hypothetical protein
LEIIFFYFDKIVLAPVLAGILKRLPFYLEQGCQMVYFQTKNPNLGKFWRALELKMLVYFMTIWNIL